MFLSNLWMDKNVHHVWMKPYECGLISQMAMGRNLWLHFGVDEHPFVTYFDVHQGYRVLAHSQINTGCLARVVSIPGNKLWAQLR